MSHSCFSISGRRRCQCDDGAKRYETGIDVVEYCIANQLESPGLFLKNGTTRDNGGGGRSIITITCQNDTQT